MTISVNSLAAANAAGAKNVTLSPTPQVVPRKLLIIGSGDPTTEAANALNEAILVTSPADVGAKTGFGFMLHRLALAAYKESGGLPTYIVQQAEDGATVQADGSIAISGTATASGTMAIYIAYDKVEVTVTKGDLHTEVSAALEAAINANDDLPVTAVDTAGTIALTAKSGGTFGNDISIETDLASDDVAVAGLTIVITDMSSGAGDPDVTDALNGLGTGDLANEMFYTDVIASGYGQVTAQLDAIANYVGQGNDYNGLWSKTVHRPFYALSGDTTAGSAGLTALVAVGDGRKSDRGNGIIAVPGSASHPAEIAAMAIAKAASGFNIRAEETPANKMLAYVHPGATADRWTSDHTNRDTAVKAGISPTIVKNGKVYLQNVCTFYHPDSVPQTSNGYRSVTNISKLQNILYNLWLRFEQEDYQGVTIVADVSQVTNSTSALKVKDEDSVRGTLEGLATQFAQKAWLYNDTYTLDNISVEVREGADGFTTIMPVILSGEGLVFDNMVYFDTSIAVLSA